MPTRVRIDRLLVDLGFSDSREKAQRSILAGQVYVEERVIDKPGTLVMPDAQVRVVQSERYVGRGGYKLEAALDRFQIDPRDQHCLDVGASTGGFTDCLLQRGATKVYALDVGHNQLAWKIRSDPRVIVFEGVNARYMVPKMLFENRTDHSQELYEGIEIAVADVSFISLTLILPSIFACVNPGANVIVLIKPQFELSAAAVGKGGIVRNEEDRMEAVEKIRRFVLNQAGRRWNGVMDSPILGAKGNKEYLAWLG
jgi:23S rRNA (cytidine1920-2'-O)/16S rRNA (cytidine1409-2'-O)-methyltransferase